MGRRNLEVTQLPPEAALMILNSLEGDNRTAMLDTPSERFDIMNVIYEVFDSDYLFDPVQESPIRMEELDHRIPQTAVPSLCVFYVRLLDSLVFAVAWIGKSIGPKFFLFGFCCIGQAW